MPGIDLIDHSPQHPVPAPPIPTAANVVLIDNYDSFTWNVYQYLVLEGARVTVLRNDEVTLAALIAQAPTQLVVSPGPGHPATDSGISQAAIAHFGGRIPVLGVCMGEQCIYAVYGGQVAQTGEILHGKTSALRHDGRGVYAGLAQDLPVTRYHSLAGTHATLPACLEVSSWVAAGADGGEGVIMGVRHRELLVEGVQFHPESILTAEGRAMLKNFLHMRGGTWAENARLQSDAADPQPTTISTPRSDQPASSILHRIYAARRTAVASQQATPSLRPSDLHAAHALALCPPLISFRDRLTRSPFPLALMAEIKRASPSKGAINPSACAPAQARAYAAAGASVISVLTEPEWFQGSIDDLRAVRVALEGMPGRPAVLRKEFVFCEYQILEARVAGADSVLLIVKMLEVEVLARLYAYSVGLGMEPLVEVNTAEEMGVAVRMGCAVIGVNNRDLTSFAVDLGTTRRLVGMVRPGTVVCALSGIGGRGNVEGHLSSGVGAVLVGEALMRAQDTGGFVRELLGGEVEVRGRARGLLVKICGTRSAEAARAAVEAGADLVGVVLVTGRKRCVSTQTALEISKVVHSLQRPPHADPDAAQDDAKTAGSWFQHTARHHLYNAKRALLVGVFQNQALEYVLEMVHTLDLDIVQLHGEESLEWARLLPVPCIRCFQPGDAGLATRGQHSIPLIDSGAGGTGKLVDGEQVRSLLEGDEGLHVLLAGGLNAQNVRQTMEGLGGMAARVAGVDVSSGVESEGVQDLGKIRDFVRAARGIERA